MITGVENYRFEVNGMRFDAAIDFEYQLHPYTGEARKMLPVELYNLDLDWDIKMSYFDNSFREIESQGFLLALIKKEAKEWCMDWIKEDGTYDQFCSDEQDEDFNEPHPEYVSYRGPLEYEDELVRELEESYHRDFED